MMVGMRVLRGGLTAALLVASLSVATVATGIAVSGVAVAQTAASVVVEGNRRVDSDTIRSYFKPGPSGRLDVASIDDALKALIATGLFADVKINNVGGRIVVTVVENQVINRVAFEGNKKIKDDQLSLEVQSKPRGTFSRATVQADTLRIAEIYRRSGRFDVRVEPKIVEQPNNRVDLIFEVTEGAKTGVKSIEFIGNKAFSSYRLKDIIKTRESNILSFLASGDLYDPDRVEADRDLIRRYYLKNGYADVQVIAALTEFDPEKKGFIVTFTIEEGEQYRVGSVDYQTSIAGLDANYFRSFSRIGAGSVYNAEAVEKSVEEMTIEASRRGYAFAQVRPRGERNTAARTVSIVFVVEEGARVYIERINVRGNTRTRDYVIRREFDVAEGDAYNRALVDRAERRLKNLDFFKSVKIGTEPGSSTDRVVLNVDLEEKSTGDFSVSGGYSSADGLLGEVSISEKNLLGRGLFARAALQYGQRARGYTLSFVEPYLFDYRVALGLDVFQREQLASRFQSFNTKTVGFSPRLGFTLREDLALQVRYSFYRQEITLPAQLRNCNNPGSPLALAGVPVLPTPLYNNTLGGIADFNTAFNLSCYVDGESSLPIRQELAKGSTNTSLVGYTLIYNTLDSNKDPTSGLLLDFKQDFAGLGGDVRFIRTQFDGKYYSPLPFDLVGVLRLQAGNISGIGKDLRMLDHFQMGPNLVRGFAPAGIGPRDITFGSTNDALGGTTYFGASAEIQVPFFFLPKEVGLKGALYADAGTVFDYKGPTQNVPTGEVGPFGLIKTSNSEDRKIRSSVGAGIIWASPFGPLRFDYSIPLTKGKFDRVQEFRFGGGTSF
ncbi:MAG: outer membrane protein assembly factor BamA [Pseudomonadota bacterium]